MQHQEDNFLDIFSSINTNYSDQDNFSWNNSCEFLVVASLLQLFSIQMQPRILLGQLGGSTPVHSALHNIQNMQPMEF